MCLQVTFLLNNDSNPQIIIWTPVCPRSDFADKVTFYEPHAIKYGKLVIGSIRIDLSDRSYEYTAIVNLPLKMIHGLNMTNMNGKNGKWYLGHNSDKADALVLRSEFDAGMYYFNFVYLSE